jgi:hypothetical protein
MPSPSADLDAELAAAGFKIQQPQDTYIKSRDANIARLEAQKAANPVAAAAGNIAGIGGGALLTGGLAGMVGVVPAATRGARALQAAKAGAITGAVANPGDIEGDAGLQLMDRLKNAGFGFALGAGGQVGVEKLGDAAKGASNYFRSKAAEKAVRAAGANKRQMTKAFSQDQVDDLGNFLLDEKVVTPLTTPGKVAGRLEGKIASTTDELASIIDDVEKKLSDKAFWNSLKPEDKKSIIEASFRPKKEAARLKAEIKSRYDQIPDAKLKGAFEEIDAWLGDKAKVMGVKSVQDMKVQMNRFLNDSDFWKQPASFTKEGTLAVRKTLKEGVEKKSDALARVMGEQGGKVKNTNRRLGAMMELQDMAEGRVASDAANRSIGLTDTIAMMGGMAGGGTKAEQAALMALLGGANKFGRTFGNSLQATGFKNISGKFGKVAGIQNVDPAVLAPLLERTREAVVPDGAAVGKPADQILNNPQLMKFFEQNPQMIDRVIQDPHTRQAVLERVGRKPASKTDMRIRALED